VTNDANGARITRMVRDWGQERKYEHVLMGFNYRMDALQGAILRVKLRHLDAWTNARRDHALRYADMIPGAGFTPPEEMPYARHVYHVYAIRTTARAVVQSALEEQGIQTGIHYPTPVHLQPAYAFLGYETGAFPIAEAAAREVLSLPLHPDLTIAQQERVVEALGAIAFAR
jgi:dTDP-4-amino-4,6-dideoxygalactose transaminase